MCCWLIGQIKQHSAVRLRRGGGELTRNKRTRNGRYRRLVCTSTSKEKKYSYCSLLTTCMCTDRRQCKWKIVMTRLNFWLYRCSPSGRQPIHKQRTALRALTGEKMRRFWVTLFLRGIFILSPDFRRLILAVVQFIRLNWGSWIKRKRYAKKKQTSNQRECSVCLHLPLKRQLCQHGFCRPPAFLANERRRPLGRGEWNPAMPLWLELLFALCCQWAASACILLLLLLTVSRLSQECRLKIFSACFRPSTFSRSQAEASDKLTYLLDY